jgi:hypothetical protein
MPMVDSQPIRTSSFQIPQRYARNQRRGGLRQVQKQTKKETSTPSSVTYIRSYSVFVSKHSNNPALLREVDDLLAKLGSWYMNAMTGAALKALPDTCFQSSRNPEAWPKNENTPNGT